MESYVKEKIKEYLKTLKVFEARLVSDQETLHKLREQVQARVRGEKDLTPKDVSTELVKMQDIYYDSKLLEQTFTHILSRLVELDSLAQAFKIELELEEEHKEALLTLRKSSKQLFTESKGEVVVTDQELMKSLKQSVEHLSGDEARLATMFNSLKGE